MELNFDRSFSQGNATFNDFSKAYFTSVAGFAIDNKLVSQIEKKLFSIELYHSLLINIFHQVYNSSGSFALAGSMCNANQIIERQYLFHHAEEEMTHWQWILNDLNLTGYMGADPRDLSPQPNTAAYLSYGYYLALKFPVGRLAMALVLEGISAAFGLVYGRMVLEQLNLRPDQAQFFLAHGELDQGHEKDLLKILEKSDLKSGDYAQLSDVAVTTATLYKRIYNECI